MFGVEGNGLEVKTKRFFLCVAKVTERKNAEVIGFQCIARRPEDIFLNNRTKLSEELSDLLKSLNKSYLFLTLTEGWCGDAAQIVPVLNKMAEATPQLKLRLLFRDEHPDLMNQFLTNGSRAIPKIIILHPETLDIISRLGPPP